MAKPKHGFKDIDTPDEGFRGTWGPKDEGVIPEMFSEIKRLRGEIEAEDLQCYLSRIHPENQEEAKLLAHKRMDQEKAKKASEDMKLARDAKEIKKLKEAKKSVLKEVEHLQNEIDLLLREDHTAASMLLEKRLAHAKEMQDCKTKTSARVNKIIEKDRHVRALLKKVTVLDSREEDLNNKKKQE